MPGITVAKLRLAAVTIGVIAVLLLPIAEFGSGLDLGNLHPRITDAFVFTGRWAFDTGCALAIVLAISAWRLAERSSAISTGLLVLAIVLPILGWSWLLHVDSIVSYPPGYSATDKP